MSGDKNKIKEAIRKIAGAAPGDAIPCTVVAVQDYTCTVKQIENDVEITKVRLNAAQDPAKGFIIKPAVNSVVLLEAISATDYYVSMFSDVASFSLKIGSISLELNQNEITLNGGAAGSYLTDINKLVAEVNATRADIRSLKQALMTFVPTGTPADTAAWTAAFASYYGAPLVDTSVNDLKDTKVKH
jgi:hypothetical protein